MTKLEEKLIELGYKTNNKKDNIFETKYYNKYIFYDNDKKYKITLVIENDKIKDTFFYER